jgi:proteasome lid subunit RPN8/RPN11
MLSQAFPTIVLVTLSTIAFSADPPPVTPQTHAAFRIKNLLTVRVPKYATTLRLAGPHAFLADPYAQYLALRRLREVGLELLAAYHSHPGGGLLPSAADIEFARWWPCPHVIVALGRPHQPEIELTIYDC